MEVIQHRQAQSLANPRISCSRRTRQIQLHEVSVRTIHANQMRIERNKGRASLYGSYNEPSPRRERKPLKSWWNDNESKRKRRLAKYKLYETEGKAKSSLKEGFRSFKIVYMKIVPKF